MRGRGCLSLAHHVHACKPQHRSAMTGDGIAGQEQETGGKKQKQRTRGSSDHSAATQGSSQMRDMTDI